MAPGQNYFYSGTVLAFFSNDTVKFSSSYIKTYDTTVDCKTVGREYTAVWMGIYDMCIEYQFLKLMGMAKPSPSLCTDVDKQIDL